MSLALMILPIALAIAIGWAARVTKVVRDDHWPGVEALSFKVLIPAIIIHSIAGADLSPSHIGNFAGTVLATVVLAGAAVLLLGRVRGVPAPTLSTYFQGTIRFNGFIALAAADLLVGPSGLSLISVSMAVMIPVVNIACIVVMVLLCGGSTGPRRLARMVFSNPLVLGSFIGIAVNLLFGGLPDWLNETLEIVGRAALGVGLLTVGAGIRLRRVLIVTPRLLLTVLLRPFGTAGLFALLAVAVGLTPAEALAGVLVFAVPSASNGYVVAKAMGGDADLFADALAWQTLLCLVAIPLYAGLLT